MHEIDPLEKELLNDAEELGQRYHGAPVVIIVGGSREAEVPRCITASNMHEGYRLRDLLGILQTVIQIETLKHFDLLEE
jgi:hypothetical protein